MSDPMHLSSPAETDADQFFRKAKMLVLNEIQNLYGNPTWLQPIEPYIFWFSKTLQNWKAQLSTPLPDGRIYEVTYDGDKKQTYVDSYVKETNTCVPDDSTKKVVRNATGPGSLKDFISYS